MYKKGLHIIMITIKTKQCRKGRDDMGIIATVLAFGVFALDMYTVIRDHYNN